MGITGCSIYSYEGYMYTVIDDVEANVEAVFKLLYNTDVHKSMEPNGIHPDLSNVYHAEVTEPVTIIID